MTPITMKRAGGLLAVGLLALIGCKGSSGDPGAPGSSCSVTPNGNGTSTISCTDGTTATVANGTNGNNGNNGNNGADGTSCTVNDNGDGTKTISCEDGTSVTVSDGRYDSGTTVEKFHGKPVLTKDGEFAPCPAGVTTNCGKEFVVAAITSATATEAGVLSVDFTVKDASGAPYTTLASASADVVKLVPGANGSASEFVAYIYRKQTVVAPDPTNPDHDWPAATGAFANQPTSESSGTGATNGTLTNHGDGSYTYVFKKNLATATGVDGTTLVGYDRTLTHRVSIMLGGHQGPTADANFDFRPDGAAVTEIRDVVRTDACLNCHGWEFHGHGGNRLTMENCVTCHVANTYDPQSGESLDMKIMTHKIHAGRELPSVEAGGQYAIWGHGDSKASWPLAEFPAVIENCKACHTGTAAQADNWKTKPTRDACGSCHDDVDFATGANHGSGGVRTSDAQCAMCHPAESGASPNRLAVATAHDWMTDYAFKADKRNFPEFGVELAVTNVPTRGYFIAGEAPVVQLKLKDLDTAGAPYLDHTTIAEDGTYESCTATACTPRDGLFRASAFMVHGPRGKRMPALTTAARAQILSPAGATTFDLSAAGAALVLKVDNGQNLVAYYPTGGDFVMPGTITVPVVSTLFADVAAATPPEIAAWLNANTQFNQRAIAFVQDGRVGIRSRNLGKVFALQLQASAVANAVFYTTTPGVADTSIKMPGGNGSNTFAARTDPLNNDPKAVRTTDAVTYTLDPVDDAPPGTYVVSVEIADRGRHSTDKSIYKTPSVGWITFQVKQAAEEKLPAGNCNLCHQSADGAGFVLDPYRHNKKFTADAVDQCGPCHDYQRGSLSNALWGGGKPISKRVHAVHRGADLNYSLTTVDYDNGDPSGRDWQITYPQDIRNCETCHPAGLTSGTWLTKPARLPCMGCHDADAATAHIRVNTWDPTPTDPFSGDEEEACRTCH